MAPPRGCGPRRPHEAKGEGPRARGSTSAMRPASGAIGNACDHSCAGGRMTALLEVRGLRAGYGPVEVLRGIDLHVDEGEAVALLGSNGAGKSTLNNVM